MEDAVRRHCESLAAQAAAMGCPLMLPPSLYDEAKRQGVDVSNMRAVQPIPLVAPTMWWVS